MSFPCAMDISGPRLPYDDDSPDVLASSAAAVLSTSLAGDFDKFVLYLNIAPTSSLMHTNKANRTDYYKREGTFRLDLKARGRQHSVPSS
jgi:hypothetical protein